MKLTAQQLHTIILEEMSRINEMQEFWWVQNEWPEAVDELITLIQGDHGFNNASAAKNHIEHYVDFDTKEKSTGRGDFDVYLHAYDRESGANYRYDDMSGTWDDLTADQGPATMYAPQSPRETPVESIDHITRFVNEADVTDRHRIAAQHLLKAKKSFNVFMIATKSLDDPHINNTARKTMDNLEALIGLLRRG